MTNSDQPDAPTNAPLEQPAVPAAATDRLSLYGPWLLLATFIAAFWPSLQILNERWLRLDENYSHGYLVVAMIAYFLWTQRTALRCTPKNAEPRAVVLVLALSFVWAVTQVIDVVVGGMLILPLLALALVLVAYGRAIVARVAFPVLLIYVAIPVWEYMFGIPLRKLTTAVAGWWLSAFASFPSSIEGFTIRIPEGAFFVADACSGVSFFLTGITIGLAYGYLNLEGFLRRAVFLLICVSLSIVSNWVRVTSLVYIGHYTNMQSSLITESHFMYGWFIFASTMIFMMYVGYRLSAPPPSVDPYEGAAPERAQFSRAALLVALLPMLLGPVVVHAYSALPKTPHETSAMPSGFTAVDKATAQWTAFFDRPPQVITGAAIDEPPMDLLMLHFPLQTQDSEVINDLHRLEDEERWTAVGTMRITPSDVHELRHPVLELELAGADGARRLVWYWYLLGGHPSIGRFEAKLLQLRAALLDGRHDGTFAALSTACESDCSAARERLRTTAPVRVAAIDLVLSH